jgi:type I restriction enzyme S subunit
MSESREGWTRVRFGDLIENVNDQPKRVTLPLETRYIAGEHVDENQLRIDRWGTLGDDLVPPTFKRRFHPGDVLFHSRNLKKIAVPDFGGITGEKLFVLRSSSPLLLQEFVPYLLLSPAFTAYAEASWSGSVNKFLNWTPLARYEFGLPPIEEQQRAILCLDAIRSSHHAYRKAVEASRALYESAVERLIRPYLTTRVPLGTVAHRITNGFVGTAVKHYVADGVPYIRSLNVRRTGIDKSDLVFISTEFHNRCEKSQLRAGDLLTVQSGHVGETAVLPGECEGWNCHAVIITRLDRSKAEPGFIAAYLNSAIGQEQLRSYFVGSTVAHLNTSDLAKLDVPLPPLSAQQKLLRTLQDAASWADQLSQREEECASLYTCALKAICSDRR